MHLISCLKSHLFHRIANSQELSAHGGGELVITASYTSLIFPTTPLSFTMCVIGGKYNAVCKLITPTSAAKPHPQQKKYPAYFDPGNKPAFLFARYRIADIHPITSNEVFQ
jgi:hypothetical protein